jgi:uncharacterized protein YqgC (DUF456 family)
LLPAWTFWIAVFLMLVGTVGILVPALPGAAIVWAVVLVYSILDRFATIGIPWFVLLTLLGLAGATADIWVSLIGARTGGASIASTIFSLVGAAMGGIVGFFVGVVGAFPGMVVGALLGVFLNELRVHRQWKSALKATVGLVVGFTVSTVVQLSIAAAMLAIFIGRGLSRL